MDRPSSGKPGFHPEKPIVGWKPLPDHETFDISEHPDPYASLRRKPGRDPGPVEKLDSKIP